MVHRDEAFGASGREEQEQSVKAKASGTHAAEYFERFERRLVDKIDLEETSMDYWLSEEDEESNQLKRRKWKSKPQKEPYVVQGAKGPKLRPAEGTFLRGAGSRMADELSQTS